MSNEALRLEGVRKTYVVGGEEIVALDDVHLTVGADEIVALVGPSGSGKTTLCSIAGALLAPTLHATLAQWAPIFLVVDGSTDASDRCAAALIESGAPLEVLRLEKNQGKGAAVLYALDFADKKGWGYAVVFDSDGQHEIADIPKFIAASRLHPSAMVLGVPIFGPDAPAIRIA